MRIIAGKYRSRILKSLKGLELRPSSDYLRETLFNVLGPNVEGSRFLDLYAGTGAVGIEAISRGAEEAVFVEHHAPTVKLIRENLASLKIESGVEVISANAAAALQKLAKWPQQPFDFERCEIFANEFYRWRVMFNEDSFFRAAAYGFNTHCTGSGVEIEEARAFYVGAENVE